MRNERRTQRNGSAEAVNAIGRAVLVLDAVEGGASRLRDVSATTGLPKATAHRLLASLEANGLVAHEPGGGYRLGPRLLRLASSARRDLPLRAVAHPVLETLSAETGESAQLYVRSGDERVCVDAVESAHELRTIVQVGASLPLFAGSAAKVFLAYASDAERFLRQAADRQRFARQVAAVRSRGWASSADERRSGVGSVSAPVVDDDGSLLGVVSVSGPSSRISRSDARRYAPAVVAAAREIELGLGFDRDERR